MYSFDLISLFKENGQLAERQANEHFERLFETLQERKSEMLKSIEQSRNRRLDQLKTQVQNAKAALVSVCRPLCCCFIMLVVLKVDHVIMSSFQT